MVVSMCTVYGTLRAANRSHAFIPRLDKMPSSAHCLETLRFCCNKQIRRCFLSSTERSRQGRFLLVFILALDLTVCLPITQGGLKLVQVFPLYYWPGGTSWLGDGINYVLSEFWVGNSQPWVGTFPKDCRGEGTLIHTELWQQPPELDQDHSPLKDHLPSPEGKQVQLMETLWLQITCTFLLPFLRQFFKLLLFLLF